jgi:diguanylate cyclase (GGDEF)-like protein/PAS domain S-box-containing protein
MSRDGEDLARAGKKPPERSGLADEGETAGHEVRILFLDRLAGDPESPEARLREAGLSFHADRVETEDALRGHLAASPPDLILSHYELPSLEGAAALAIARRHCPAVPFVFVAPAAFEDELIDSLANGATDYALQPRLLRLVPVVRRILREQRELARYGRAEQALRDSEERFRAVAQSAVDAIVSVDARGRIAFWNQAAESTFGYPASEALGAPLDLLVPERFREAHREGMKRVASGGQSRIIGTTVELTGVRKDGREFPLELSLSRWSVRGAVFFTGIIRDITERKRTEDLLRSMSITDELTGLYNRRGFLAHAGPHLELARRASKAVIVLFADIDDMKRINDTSGHREGDRALTAVATVLKQTFRQSDIIARLGGDEFAVLAVETAADGTRRLLARLHENLDAFNAANGLALSVSVGVERQRSARGASVEALLARADRAMYDRKRRLKSERGC